MLTFSQGNLGISPRGKLETVFDNYGNQYTLNDITIAPKIHNTLNTTLNSTLLCSAGIFNLYFETGSGMVAPTGIEADRRAVVCQVYQDLSDFINAPAGTQVNIWVRDITQIAGTTAQTIGVGTGFYNLPTAPNLAIGGLVDNEIWKTIHTGVDSYTNVAAPLLVNNANTTFYHGMIAIQTNGINWNLTLNTTATASQLDLYTVVLHEAAHALGFISLIDSNGNSELAAGYDYYSRYDSFLIDHNNNPLISNPNRCSTMYDYTFTVNESALHPGCMNAPDYLNTSTSINTTNCLNSLRFLASNIIPIDIYTPICFEKGSSLSHFEDQCFVSTTAGATNGNDLYFVMSNGNGFGTTKRYLKPEERQALCDIGYSLKPTYGSTSQHSFYNYGGSDCNGTTVAGINDGIGNNGFIYATGFDIPLQINGILANDVCSGITNNSNLRFECIEDISFAGSIITTIGNDSNASVIFQSPTEGLHLLRYVPYDVVTGDRGNITYIYVFVRDCSIPNVCPLPYISQTYCYFANNSFIEVKNSSYTESIAAGTYYLTIYVDDAPTSSSPTSFIDIGAFAPNEVKVFQTSTAVVPGYANTQLHNLPTAFDFDGWKDILTLSITRDPYSYDNRIDLVGNGTDPWGEKISLVRSSCINNPPPRIDTFDYEDWVVFELNEVDNIYTPGSQTNPILGRHNNSTLFFDTTAWHDGDFDYMSLPDRSRIAQINAPYSTGIYGSFECCTLNVFSTIDIVPSTYVSVEKFCNVLDNSTINIQNEGSFIMVKDLVDGISGSDLIQIAQSGQIHTYKTTVGLNSELDYVLWSTPLANVASNNTTNTANTLFPSPFFRDYRFYGFINANYQDEPNLHCATATGCIPTSQYDGNDDDGNDYYILSATQRNQQLTAGLGYTTWPPLDCGPCNYSIQFSGKPNNGVVTVPVFHNTPSISYANLVGNPYPSAIDLDKLFEVNAGLIDPVAYIWGRSPILDDIPDPNNPGPYPISYSEDNYIIYNPTMMVTSINDLGNDPFNSDGVLASCQSFFVTTTTNAGSLIFNNSMRTKEPNVTFARQSATELSDKLWLNVLNDSDKKIAQIGIAFLDNASDSYASKEDVKTPRNHNTTFYSIINDIDLVVNAQSSFTIFKTIPLGITTSNQIGSQLTISIDKKQGVFDTQEIYIYDKLNDTYTDISANSFTFKVISTIMDNRFVLVFYKTKQQNNTNSLSQIQVINDKNNITVVSENHKKIKSIAVYDIYNFSINDLQVLYLNEIYDLQENFKIDEKYKILLIITTLEDGSVISKKISN